MKLRSFALQLKESDHKIASPPGSEYPFKILPIVSEFSFQTQYIVDFIEKRIRSEKIEVGNFNFISIRGAKMPDSKIKIITLSKTLEVEALFNETRYRELYPLREENLHKKELHPLINKIEFDNFLISMLIEGLEKVTKQYDVRFQFLIDTILDFKSQGCRNEWIHKTKHIKELNIKVNLFCKLTPCYFSLEILIYKSNKLLFNKEILRTKPDSLIYKPEFKDIIYKDGKLIITKDLLDSKPLYQIDIKEFIVNDGEKTKQIC